MNKHVCVRPDTTVAYTFQMSNDADMPPEPQDGSRFIRVPFEADDRELLDSYYDAELDKFVRRPPMPGEHYIFDGATKQWVLDEAALILSIMNRRTLELYQSDWTQGGDSPLTAEKKAEWATYRQALRDITAQPGYPTDVQWPVAPK